MLEISRTLHDRVLATYAVPGMLIGTKPRLDDENLRAGDDRSLLDDVWVIRSEDPERRVGTDCLLDFTTAVDAGNIRLNDPRRETDLTSAKVFCLEHMRRHYLREFGAEVIAGRLRHFIWIVRWRLNLGLPRMQDITTTSFEAYCHRLRGGQSSLVPVEERFEAFVQAVRAGGATWPSYENQSKRILGVSALADHLGVPRQVFAEPGLRALLADAMASTSTDIVLKPIAADAVAEGDVGISASTCLNIFLTWKALRLLSEVGPLGHDPLIIDPLQGTSAAGLAAKVGKAPTSRTGTIPAEQLMALLDGSAKWVMDYSAPIVSLYAAAGAISRRTANGSWAEKAAATLETKALVEDYMTRRPPGAPRLDWAWKGRAATTVDHTLMSLDEAMKSVLVACAVMIGVFGARRKTEVLSLQAGCATLDDQNECWLSSYICKTIRDVERLPIPRAVLEAVRCLETLSLETRTETGEQWLFKVMSPGRFEASKPGIRLELESELDAFAAIVGVPPLPDGSRWHFTAHQLRRAFAVFYYHANRYASLDALSRFLRHFDPEMTRRYITEAIAGSLQRMREIIEAIALQGETASEKEVRSALASIAARRDEFETVRQEVVVERMLDIYDASEEPFGHGARTLAQELETLIEDARRDVRIKSGANSMEAEREQLVRRLREHAKMRYIEPHPTGHTHCGAQPGNREHLAEAACLRNKKSAFREIHDERPDPAFAGPLDCLGCKFGIAFSENGRVIDNHIKAVGEAAAKAPSEPQRVAATSILDSLVAGVAAAGRKTGRRSA